MASEALTAVLVGCGRMGSNQAKIVAALEAYRLTAVCDISEENAVKASEAVGAKAYTDYAEMLEKEKPEVVCICTSNDSHADLTIRAARSGVRGVYCEKPMATNMADARAMVAACREEDVALVVNHQRRIGGDLLEARKLIESGAVGQARLIRGQCAGDILSDGTHLVDSVLWLAGEEKVCWVFGQVHRMPPDASEEKGDGYDAGAGFRFGHAVETGGMAIVEFESGLRAELLTGDMRENGRVYQDYEIIGDAGRLWRTDDSSDPNLFLQDIEGGAWNAGMDKWKYKPVPGEEGARDLWRPAPWKHSFDGNHIAESYCMFARTVRQGAPHPMNGDAALAGFEVVMAIYESARLRKKIHLPLEQDRFPLDLMIEAGEL